MLAEVVDLLRCPHCGGGFALTDGTVGCPRGHRFDVARQGHLTLLRGPAGASADTAAMVAARDAFLRAGHYGEIASLVAGAAAGRVVLEAGAGTGYYLARVLDHLGPTARGIATDLSAYACRRSAKLPRVGAIVADTWAGLPIADGVVDTLLTVFAPRNPREFVRVLSPQGRVLVVTPLPDHLAELRRSRGLMDIEAEKQERLLASMEPMLRHSGHQVLRFDLTLTPPEVDQLIGMGPNAFHTAANPPAASDEPIRTAVSVRLDVFGPATQRCT